MTQTADSLFLDLTNTFTSEVELLPDLLKCKRLLIIETEIAE